MDEALTNIIRHSYRGRRGQPMEISCRRLGPGAGRALRSPRRPPGRPHTGRLEFFLVDYGRGVHAAKLRGRPLHEVRPGGLGTHCIQEIMDEVKYERIGGRNRLRLVKYLKRSR